MAINLYDQPAQAQFMQTYVPVPFGELMQAGAMQQQRWEEADALTQGVQSEIGNVNALERIQLASGESVEVGDWKHVSAKVTEFTGRIEELVTGIQDKSSPEYRAKLRNIIQDLRKEQSAKGTFGRAQANIASYQDIVKRREEAKLGEGIHRAIGQDIQLREYAKRSADTLSGLEANAPILEKVEVHKFLTDNIKNINSMLMRDASIRHDSTLMGQLRMESPVEGISAERVRNAAIGLLTTSDEIMTDLQARAYSRGLEGAEAEEYIKQAVGSLANTMAEIYQGNKMSVSWKEDPIFMAKYKKQLDNEDLVFATTLNLPIAAAKGFGNIEELDKTIQDRNNNISELRLQALDALNAEWNIPEGAISMDPSTGLLTYSEPALQGVSRIDTGAPADLVDLAKLVNHYNMQIEQAQKASEDAKRYKSNMLRKHGIDEGYFGTAQYKESVDKAKKKAGQEFDRRTSTGTIGSDRYLSQLETSLGTTGKEATRRAYIENNYVNFIEEVDDRYKKLNADLKEQAKSGSYETAAVNLPKDFKEYLEDTILNAPGNLKLEWYDSRKGRVELSPEERKTLIDDAKEKPRAIGPYYDQEKGEIRLMYSIKDKKGVSHTVSTVLPQGMEEAIHSKGLFDKYASIIYTGLYNQLGAANNISGTGVLRLPGGTNVEYLGKNTTGQYVVNVPTDKGNIEAVSFNSIKEMIETLTVIARVDMDQKSTQ